MKVAIVYDRVNKWGGAERVLLALHELFPKAPLYTAVYSKEKAQWAEVFPKVIPSYLNKISWLSKNHELLGALVPMAFESFGFNEYELVISITSEAAKGIITRPKTIHVCYCLTPTRYLYSGREVYQKERPRQLRFPFYGFISKPVLSYVEKWDQVAAQRPDGMIAISTEVKNRIKRYYDRDSEIIFPPVNVEKITNIKLTTTLLRRRVLKLTGFQLKEYYLIVSRMVPYKRVSLAVDAFNELKKPLVVVGTGSEEVKLKRTANENIVFTGFVKEQDLVLLYKGAKGFIFPQEEDFGITAVEAQAAGIPVIAYRGGGAQDTVIEGKTGKFFEDQKTKSLIKAVKEFEKINFNSEIIIKNAEKFTKARFKKEFKKYINTVLK
jgi:glycosyltransferase involved in cell wall biosynthesis